MSERADIHTHDTRDRNVVVVGGANTDIAGVSLAPIVERDSNPGRVEVSAGGVARNVAETLARLGVGVHLISAFGDDQNARDLVHACRDAGVDTAGSLTVGGLPGSVYLSIMDERGDMVLALSDMRPLEHLAPSALEARVHILERAELVVLDANLPAETIEWLAGVLTAPIVLDTVSTAKAPRVRAVLPRLHTLKASGLEAGVLLGRKIRNRDHALDAARELVSLGVSRAFVTSGAFGVAWADASDSGQMPAPSVAEVRNATGAGDAFAAGVAYATLEAWPIRQAAAFGSACAALALESEDTVSTSMSREAAIARMDAMLT